MLQVHWCWEWYLEFTVNFWSCYLVRWKCLDLKIWIWSKMFCGQEFAGSARLSTPQLRMCKQTRFRKKQVSLKLTIFFTSRNNHILTKVTTFTVSTLKIKCWRNSFVNFADIFSDSLFSWTICCTLYFERKLLHST